MIRMMGIGTIEHELSALLYAMYQEEPISEREFDHRIDMIKDMVDKLSDDNDKTYFLDTIEEWKGVFKARRNILSI